MYTAWISKISPKSLEYREINCRQFKFSHLALSSKEYQTRYHKDHIIVLIDAAKSAIKTLKQTDAVFFSPQEPFIFNIKLSVLYQSISCCQELFEANIEKNIATGVLILHRLPLKL